MQIENRRALLTKYRDVFYVRRANLREFIKLFPPSETRISAVYLRESDDKKKKYPVHTSPNDSEPCVSDMPL